MKSSALQAMCWVLLIFCNTVQTQPQTKPAKKEAASSISGKVTIKDKGAPGIAVILRPADFRGQSTARYQGITDQDGKYKIVNVVPGNYQATTGAPAFVNSAGLRGKTLIIAEGETIGGIDFDLIRGGVITGKVVDADGLPLIEEQISLWSAEANAQGPRNYVGLSRPIQTDDRGVYRIFGIPPGKYKVALGNQDGPSGGPRKSRYKQTFSPGVTDSSKASVIEVTEGSETKNVDIAVGLRLATFTVSGRIVDRETLQGVPHLKLGLQAIVNDRDFGGSCCSDSNGLGEFKLENVTPGKYAVFVPPQPNNDLRSDAVPFEVIDQDVTGLLVKTSEGASLSGFVVLEGVHDKSVLALLSQVQLNAVVTTPGNEGAGRWGHSLSINPEGSFRVGGLQSGLAYFSLNNGSSESPKGITLVRMERDGLAQPNGIEIKEGEQVTGVRIVLSYGSGTIRGVVKIENGELPPAAQFAVWLSIPGDDGTIIQRSLSPPVDSRGHFLCEGLAAGTYSLRTRVFIPGSRARSATATQQVNVADGAVTEVTVKVNLNPIPVPSNP